MLTVFPSVQDQIMRLHVISVSISVQPVQKAINERDMSHKTGLKIFVVVIPKEGLTGRQLHDHSSLVQEIRLKYFLIELSYDTDCYALK